VLSTSCEVCCQQASAAQGPDDHTTSPPAPSFSSAKPTFKWSKAARATRYEVRVYQGRQLLRKKTSITKRSWKSSKALPKNISLTWKVRARNAAGNGVWSKRLRFKAVTAPSSAKSITDVTAPTSTVTTINETDHTIALTVSHGINVTALVATFTTSGAAVSPASGVANDFTSPATYTVTAANASTQDYTITVTVAAGQVCHGRNRNDERLDPCDILSCRIL